jgi:zinc protease
MFVMLSLSKHDVLLNLGLFLPDAAPDRAPVPPAPEVALQVRGYKGEAAMATGEAFEATPANINARTKRSQEGGVKLALLPKQNRGNAVSLQLKLRYGDEASLTNKPALASLTAAMLERGTKTRSYSQIRDAFDKAKAQVSIYGSGQSTNVAVQTSKANLPAVLAVVLDCLRNPTFPAAEFEKLKQERLAGLESQKQDPQGLAFNLAQRLSEPYPKGHPFETLAYDDEIAAIKALKVEDVRAFYKTFYGAHTATLAVVGSFDEPALRKSVKSQLASWKAGKAYARIPLRAHGHGQGAGHSNQRQGQRHVRVGPDVSAARRLARLPGRVHGQLHSGRRLPQLAPGHPHSPERRRELRRGLVCVRRRQRPGGQLYVLRHLQSRELGPSGTSLPRGNRAPEQGRRDGGRTKAAKSAALQNFQVTRSQDEYLARTWSQYLTKPEGRTFAYDAELEQRIGALTAEQVSAAAKKYLDYTQLTIVKAGDFAKAAAQQVK